MKITNEEKMYVDRITRKLLDVAKDRGLNYARLAEKTKISDNNVARILSGRCPNPSILAIRRICQALMKEKNNDE